MGRSTAIFTLKRERVPLAFQAGHAGSIPVTRATEKQLHRQNSTRTLQLLIGLSHTWISWCIAGRPWLVWSSKRSVQGIRS
jgi:hypothetical protein